MKRFLLIVLLACASSLYCDDDSKFVFAARGAYGFQTENESMQNIVGTNYSEYEIGIKGGYEWKWIELSLGYNYELHSTKYSDVHYLGSANITQTHSIPYLVEFYIPFRRIRPGIVTGPCLSFSRNESGDWSEGVSVIYGAVIKYLLTPSFEISADARFNHPFSDSTLDTYGSGRDARWTLGISVGLRI